MIDHDTNATMASMDSEIQIALSFVISYLYNKLPRRRVNLFGEEMDKAIRRKFEGHWYPNKPFKGSAYRCLRASDPFDTVMTVAAQESGLAVQDILENLPNDMSVWIDPGEVSYRIGEKGVVKILYSKHKVSSPTSSSSSSSSPLSSTSSSPTNSGSEDNGSSGTEQREHSFNPEAQCFKPIDKRMTDSMRGLNLGSDGSSSGSISPPNNASSPIQAFMHKSSTPLTFTTATFAQTKFGSTKLKNNGKRQGTSRMSPTEFSHYIKQRAIAQHHHHHHQHNNHHHQLHPPPPPHHQQHQATNPSHPQQHNGAIFGGNSPRHPRSLSPNLQQQNFDPFMFMAATNQHAVNQNQRVPSRGQQRPQQLFEGNYINDIFSNATTLNNNNNNNQTMQCGGAMSPNNNSVIQRPNFLDITPNISSLQSSGNNSPTTNEINDNHKTTTTVSTSNLLDSFNFNNAYTNNQFQHLLLAN